MTNIKRNSTIETLRIISILLIIASHFSVHGLFEFDYIFSVDYMYMDLLKMCGDFGVDIFVLITGYFMIKDQNLNGKKVFSFWIQVLFYSVVIYLFVSLIGFEQFSIKELCRSFLPISFGKWWFASTYFVLLVLHPFLNRLITSIDKRWHEYLIVILVLFWSVIPTFMRRDFEGNNLLWFITLYCISSYVQIYSNKNRGNAKYYVLLFVISLIVPFSIRMLHEMGISIPVLSSMSSFVYSKQSLFTLIRALSVFLFAITRKETHNAIVNNLAAASFGIYLIHDSKSIRPVLWNYVFELNQNLKINIVLYSLICIVVIYCACFLIDMLRKKLFETSFVINLMEKIYKTITIAIKSLLRFLDPIFTHM